MLSAQLRGGGADESAGTPGSVGRAPCGPGRRSSISGWRYRQPPAVHPQARAGSPRTPAQFPGLAAPEPFDLAPGGVYLAARVTPGAGALLPHRFTLTSIRGMPAVCFLWHCPAGHPGWVLPTTPPCGARTFLGGSAGAEPTRPPGRLIHDPQHMTRRPDPGGSVDQQPEQLGHQPHGIVRSRSLRPSGDMDAPRHG